MLRLLLFVAVLALVIYVLIRTAQGRGSLTPPRGLKSQPPRPLAPDDDPEFLRELDRKRRAEGDSDT